MINRRDRKASITKFTSIIIFFSLMFGIALIMFFILHGAIYWFQKFLFQQHNEILMGSWKILTGIVCLVSALDLLLLIFLYSLMKKRYSRFYYRYCYDIDNKIQVDEKLFSKFKIALIGILIFGAYVTYIYFNEYIALGNKYIAASSASLMHNRQEYNYSDVQILKRPRKNSNLDWTYIYRFQDGKEIGDLGSSLGANNIDLIAMIQSKQKGMCLDISNVYLETYPKKLATPVRFLSYSIWTSMFFFIPWTLRKLFKRKS